MTISSTLLAIAIWTAIAGVAIGATYLLAVLIKEIKSGSLW